MVVREAHVNVLKHFKTTHTKPLSHSTARPPYPLRLRRCPLLCLSRRRKAIHWPYVSYSCFLHPSNLYSTIIPPTLHPTYPTHTTKHKIQKERELTTTQPQCKRKQNHRQRNRKVVDHFLPRRGRNGHGSECCSHEFHSLV